MVKEIRNAETSLGKISFDISKSSKKNLNSKRSIYVSKNIKKGDIISKDNIRIVRPNFGLHPKFFQKILGKKINKNLYPGDRMKMKFILK